MTMWNSSLSCWCARLVLPTCLALSVFNARGSDSAKGGRIAVATKFSWAEQQGGKTADQPKTPSAKPVDDDYIIGPSDMLAINVWKDAELSRTVLVRPDGKISLPLVGELEVSGLTALRVQRLLAERFKEYIDHPQVTVIVEGVKSRTYTIVGKISKQGSYELGKPTTVLEAIAIAGGPLDFAKTNKIVVVRRWGDGSTIRIPFDYKKALKGKGTDENIELRNGDTIVIP